MSIYGSLLEYSGNDAKNTEFEEILKELYNLMQYFKNNIAKLSEYLDLSITDLTNVKKNPKLFKKKLDEFKNKTTEYNDWFKNVNKKSLNESPQLTWQKLKKKAKTFNNKYSTIGMENKKYLVEKIIKDRDYIIDLAKPWCKDQEKTNKMIKLFDEVKEIDEEYARAYNRIFADLYDYFFDECEYTVNDINYVIRLLNINKEKSLSYKLVQAIFKD